MYNNLRVVTTATCMISDCAGVYEFVPNMAVLFARLETNTLGSTFRVYSHGAEAKANIFFEL